MSVFAWIKKVQILVLTLEVHRSSVAQALIYQSSR